MSYPSPTVTASPLPPAVRYMAWVPRPAPRWATPIPYNVQTSSYALMGSVIMSTWGRSHQTYCVLAQKKVARTPVGPTLMVHWPVMECFVASSPVETSHLGSPNGLVFMPESQYVLWICETIWKQNPKAEMDEKPTVKVGLTYLPPSSYHALHSQFTILCPSQSVPLEPVIYVLKISHPSWYSVFQKHSVTASIIVSQMLYTWNIPVP